MTGHYCTPCRFYPCRAGSIHRFDTIRCQKWSECYTSVPAATTSIPLLSGNTLPSARAQPSGPLSDGDGPFVGARQLNERTRYTAQAHSQPSPWLTPGIIAPSTQTRESRLLTEVGIKNGGTSLPSSPA